MTKISIGIVLSQLMKEQNMSAINIAERTGKTRQNVYMDLKRTAMRDDNIEEWAKALDIDKRVIYDRWNADVTKPASNDSADYLMDHLAALEEQFKRLLNQLETKDNQIQNLQEMLKMAMGKLKPASEFSKVKKLWPDLAA